MLPVRNTDTFSLPLISSYRLRTPCGEQRTRGRVGRSSRAVQTPYIQLSVPASCTCFGPVFARESIRCRLGRRVNAQSLPHTRSAQGLAEYAVYSLHFMCMHCLYVCFETEQLVRWSALRKRGTSCASSTEKALSRPTHRCFLDTKTDRLITPMTPLILQSFVGAGMFRRHGVMLCSTYGTRSA